MSEFGDDTRVTGSVEISGGFDVVGSTVAHDLASGISITQNYRAGSITLTNNGSWATNASNYFRLYSSEIKSTDVIAISTSRSMSIVHQISEGMAVINLTNKGSTIADDSETIVNWTVL